MGGAQCHGCVRPGALEPDAVGDERVAQQSDIGTASDQAESTTGLQACEAVCGSTWSLPHAGRLTVMMFGMTGAGKSALGNLLADAPVFEAADDTASVTNLSSCMRYEAPDGSLIVLDTIGLGDTEIDQDKVVASIRDVALSAPLGVDVLFFVMRQSRITDDAIARLIYVTEFLWGSDCLLNLYIVVTHASRYLNRTEEGVAWIERQVEINWRFKHMYGLVGNNPHRFIFVDNPDALSGEPMVEERQRASREALVKCLALHPRDIVPPFTHEMMREAARLSTDEIAELQLRIREEQSANEEDSVRMRTADSGDTLIGSTRRSARRSAGKRSDKISQELRERRARARQKREAAERALRQRRASAEGGGGKARIDVSCDLELFRWRLGRGPSSTPPPRIFQI